MRLEAHVGSNDPLLVGSLAIREQARAIDPMLACQSFDDSPSASHRELRMLLRGLRTLRAYADTDVRTFELLALTRPGVPLRNVAALPASQSLDVAAVRFLESDQSSYGLALALTGGLKAHF